MRKKRRFKNTTPLLIAGGIVFVLAAIFGVYKLSDAVLNRVFPSPNAVVSSAVPSSEAVISSQPALTPESETLSSAAVSSAASSAGNADLPVITGIFGSYNTAAQRKLSAMTLKEKVGQVFVFRCPESGAVKTAEEYQPGGYCLMAANFQNKTIVQVQSMLKSYQSASKTHMWCCQCGRAVFFRTRNPFSGSAHKLFAAAKCRFSSYPIGCTQRTGNTNSE